jgi:hypothetical protein
VAHKLDTVLRAFVSWGRSPYPVECPECVGKLVGPDEAKAALARVYAVMADLDAIIPDWTRHDLAQAAQYAARQVADAHPEIGPDGIAALIWTYSGWYK